jgi:ABC-type xylose transport system substrate-binding protein
LKRLQDEFTVRMSAINAEAEVAAETSDIDMQEDEMETNITKSSSVVMVDDEDAKEDRRMVDSSEDSSILFVKEEACEN